MATRLCECFDWRGDSLLTTHVFFFLSRVLGIHPQDDLAAEPRGRRPHRPSFPPPSRTDLPALCGWWLLLKATGMLYTKPLLRQPLQQGHSNLVPSSHPVMLFPGLCRIVFVGLGVGKAKESPTDRKWEFRTSGGRPHAHYCTVIPR